MAKKQAKKRSTRPLARPARKAAPRKAPKSLKHKRVTKARKAAAPPARKPAKKVKPKVRAAVRRVAARPTVVKKAVKKAVKKVVPATKVPVKKAAAPPPARLQRERRRLPEAEGDAFTGTSGDPRLLSSARAGHDELRAELKKHTEGGPEMTADDVDAKWQDAYALGDEAPGGDNMTPDQDRVDDIGKALGIEYADDEELMGGDEITKRDEHRWELDPESKDEDEDL